MGKRSSFDRNQMDFYPTPRAAVEPLLDHVAFGSTFCEPCAGEGDLIAHLEGARMVCVAAYDLEDRGYPVTIKDALLLEKGDIKSAQYIITNPPWDRPVLHRMIEVFSDIAPTWLLFDADWMHTRQSSDLIKRCRSIVSVGRVKWIPDSKMTGKDNCCWYLFGPMQDNVTTVFYGR